MYRTIPGDHKMDMPTTAPLDGRKLPTTEELLRECEALLFAHFASPATPEGRKALAMVNRIRSMVSA